MKPPPPAPDTRPLWYCVALEPRYDLACMMRLHAQGFETFVPLFRARPGALLQAVFPGYLFVRFDIGRDHWRPIATTRHVLRLFSISAERPLSMPDHVIAELAERYGPQGTEREPETPGRLTPIAPGTVMRVAEGPFASFQGVCTWSTAERIGLLVDLFGRASAMSGPRSLAVPI